MQRGEREGERICELRLTANQEVRGTVANTTTYHPLPETGAVGDGGGPSEREFAASRSFKESGCLGYWKDFFAASHPYR